MHFLLQNRKLARLSSICIGCQNGPRNRREQPIFDLGLSWFALITLKTGSRAHLRKNQLGRWNVHPSVYRYIPPLLYTPPDFSTNFFGQCEFFGENHRVLPTILPIFQNIVKKPRILPVDFTNFSKNCQKNKGTPYEFISFFKKHQKSKGTPYEFISFFNKKK